MTVPLDTVNDIRSMDAAGRSRSEIARMLHVSRNTVAKYADMEDMSPAAPMPRRRGRPALEGNEEWVAGVLEADLGAPRKQRHTARRIYDRLVAERGYGGSYSTVQRFVRELRLARAAAGGEGYLELEWAPGTCQVDFGNFRAAVGGRTLDLKLLVATLPHSNDRQCVALMSQRSECLCAGLLEIFRRWGRAPAAMVLDNATEAGRRRRDVIVESDLFRRLRLRYGFTARFCNPSAGKERGNVEGKVGYTGRNLFVPVPEVDDLQDYDRGLAETLDAHSEERLRYEKGLSWAALFQVDKARLPPLPKKPFDVVKRASRTTDGHGRITLDGRHRHLASPSLACVSLTVGARLHGGDRRPPTGRRQGPAAGAPASSPPPTRTRRRRSDRFR